ncbi:hypothetical protein FRC12_015295 [Ceratobasidium sp. 428]|nr:hypothetical protein FRC12_015295 [Ceratobasidium sp. 428]
MRFATVASAAVVLIGAAAPAAAWDFSSYNPKCHLGEFYWNQKGIECLTVGGPGYGGNPPPGHQCPTLWYWHQRGLCAPRYSPPFSQPSCPGNWVWNPSSYSCQAPATPPPSGNNCPRGQFWWKQRSCCLQDGGPPSPPLPPRGHWCPSYWYWHPIQNSCVPVHPTPPPPSCPPGSTWNPYIQCCKPDDTPQPPPPTPSHKPRSAEEKRAHNAHKKKAKRTQAELTFCEVGHENCPIKGVFSDESECVDTTSQLNSCGGCTSIGQGQNCLDIPNMEVSTCNVGTCEVLKCKDGYTIGPDKKSCVALLP